MVVVVCACVGWEVLLRCRGGEEGRIIYSLPEKVLVWLPTKQKRINGGIDMENKREHQFLSDLFL